VTTAIELDPILKENYRIDNYVILNYSLDNSQDEINQHTAQPVG